jgi:hypothetical protein
MTLNFQMTLNLPTLSTKCHGVQCRYAAWHYAECRYAECHFVMWPYARCHYADCHSLNLN